MKKTTWIAMAGSALLLGATALPALAGLPPYDVGVQEKYCGVKFHFEGKYDTGYKYKLDLKDKCARFSHPTLVVDALGYTHTIDLCDYIWKEGSHFVGPFYDVPGSLQENVNVQWRVYGGPERDWDIPLWFGYPDFGGLVGPYIGENGEEWETAGPWDPNPFTSWKSFAVKPCVITTDKCQDYWEDWGFSSRTQCTEAAYTSTSPLTWGW